MTTMKILPAIEVIEVPKSSDVLIKPKKVAMKSVKSEFFQFGNLFIFP